MSYDLDAYYTGEITQQLAGQSKDNDLQIFLEVRLEGKLLDKFNPDGGVDRLTDAPVVQVRLNFREHEQGLQILRQDLEKLGWSGDDPMELVPEAENYHSFVGQKVILVAKASAYNGKTSIFWNLRFPRRFQARLDTEKVDIVTDKARTLWRKSKKAADMLENAATPF